MKLAFTISITLALAAAASYASTRSFIESMRSIERRVEAYIQGDPPVQKLTDAWLQQWDRRRLVDAFYDYNDTVIYHKDLKDQQQKAIELAACARMIAARIEEGR